MSSQNSASFRMDTTVRHKTNSHYYREQMLKYEDDIERLQAEVEKSTRGTFKDIVILRYGRIGRSKEKVLEQG